MVRLKALNNNIAKVRTPGFNSTMVRLKDPCPSRRHQAYRQFQFHNGSIKSNLDLFLPKIAQDSFNSTMVRLKV